MFDLGGGFYVYDIGLLVITILGVIIFSRAYFNGKDLKMLLGLLICLRMIFGDSRLLYSQYYYVNIVLGIINFAICFYLFIVMIRLYVEYRDKEKNRKKADNEKS